MNIVKIGGSIINPDGEYDNRFIAKLIDIVKESKERFIFVVGGGKLCRKVQMAAKPFREEALTTNERISYANDLLGIAVTKINASYVLEKFKEQLGSEVEPEIIIDPTKKIKSSARIYFTGGWKPGCSTDKDMMIMAEIYGAKKIVKVTDVEYIKQINPLKFSKLSEPEKKKVLAEAKDIKEMSWKQLVDLIGTDWKPGLNTPFDSQAAELGYTLRKQVMLLLGRKEELERMLTGKKFKGTIVKG